jgi:hypothetical protein
MIRGILKIFFAACFVAGGVALFGAYQLQRCQSAATIEPQVITLAELLKKENGSNAHVTVTDFRVGKPAVDKSGAKDEYTWVPLTLSLSKKGKAAKDKTVFLRRNADDEDPSADTVTAIVASQMPSPSPWEARLPTRIAEEFGVKSANAIVLVEPEVVFGEWRFEPELVFEPRTCSLAWAVGGTLALIGLGGLLWMGRLKSLMDADEAASLAAEPAVSTHEFNAWEFARRGWKVFLFCGILIAFCAVLFGAGVSLLKKSPDGAYVIMGMSSLFILINLFLIQGHYQYRSHGVAQIDVCASGLRWTKVGDSTQRVAAWTQIENLELQHGSPYSWRHALVITFLSGESLRLAAFSLTEYHEFAKLIRDGYDQRQVRMGGPSRKGSLALAQALSQATN